MAECDAFHKYYHKKSENISREVIINKFYEINGMVLLSL